MLPHFVRVTATTDAPRDTPADTVAIGIFGGEGVAHDTSGGELQALLDAGEAKPAFKHLAVAHADGKRWLLARPGARRPPAAATAAAATAGAPASPPPPCRPARPSSERAACAGRCPTTSATR